jgi:hypothetical protein
MGNFLLGAVTLASVLVGLFFLRFWGKTGDRIFLFFAFSFWIEGASRVLEGALESASADVPLVYSLRLMAYLLILWAIVDKNWLRRGSSE